MSHLEGGPLSAYNSLLDPHLAGYFANDKMRRHLRRSGLITRRGEIISENSYRINMAKKEHKKHVRELLAQAIVHKTLDEERSRQVKVKKKLEEISKIELVRRVKADRGRKGDEDILPFLSPKSRKPRPSSVPAGKSKRPDSAHSSTLESERTLYDESASVGRRPRSSSSAGSRRRGRLSYPKDEIDDKHLHTLNSETLYRYKQSRALDGDMLPSPYTYPHVSGMAPVPPKATPRGSAGRRGKSKKAYVPKEPERKKEEPSIEGSLMLHRNEPAVKYQEKMQTFAVVTMHYFGRELKLDHERFDDGKDEILIEQQHCGGNTLTVFKERLSPKSDLKFRSRRHRGYPFSLTLYINGVKDSRISTCCEFKHSTGLHLGCKTGHFGIVSVEGVAPCFKCLLAERMKQDENKKKKKKPRGQKSEAPPESDIEVPVSEENESPKEKKKGKTSKEKDPPNVTVPLDGKFDDQAQSEDPHGESDESDSATQVSGPDHVEDTNRSDSYREANYDDDFDDHRSNSSSSRHPSSESGSSDSETTTPRNQTRN